MSDANTSVMVVVEHDGVHVTEASRELLATARSLANALSAQVEAVVLGSKSFVEELGAADLVVHVEHPVLDGYLGEAYEAALMTVIAARSPRLVLFTHATVGLDLAAAISVRWDAALVSSACAIEVEGVALIVTSRILGGKILVELEVATERAVVSVLAGSFVGEEPIDGVTPGVIDMAPPALEPLRTTCRQVHELSGSDVDIGVAEMLVSVGRGIESQDNLEVAQELADALGVPLSASRPIVDAGWLDKSRQVGQSGRKVRPKAYLAFGISGAPEHLEGMGRAELIIACNTDPDAPIFSVAHFGTTLDLFDLLPALVQKLVGSP